MKFWQPFLNSDGEMPPRREGSLCTQSCNKRHQEPLRTEKACRRDNGVQDQGGKRPKPFGRGWKRASGLCSSLLPVVTLRISTPALLGLHINYCSEFQVYP